MDKLELKSLQQKQDRVFIPNKLGRFFLPKYGHWYRERNKIVIVIGKGMYEM